jgi:cell shape-determining protein MreD
MSWLPTIILLLTAYLLVFAQATFNGFRSIVGVQLDLLPSLMVYAGLTRGLPTLVVLAVCAGLWFDSLSANAFGVSVLPLFLVGLAVQRYQALIARDQVFAQRLIGMAASIIAPVLTLVLLLNTERKPLLGWFLLWHWLVLGLAGALVTPLWFKFFDWLARTLSYRPIEQTTFRPDRHIKRGRF